MLINFINYINKTNPDVLIAWNGDGFDFPFIVNRIEKLGLDTIKLGRTNRECYTIKLKGKSLVFKTKIFGRVCFDLMRAYKKMHSNEGRDSWSLDYISKYENVAP